MASCLLMKRIMSCAGPSLRPMIHVRLQEAYPSNKLETWGIKLADDVLNPYVRGKDATTGKKVVNYGNYGVMYDVILPTKGKAGHGPAL